MPFINERLEANRETLARNRADSGPVRVSRFRFEPDAVMASLRANIVGQQHALEAMESMLVRVKADIGEENRPLAVHLFLGPTGVGKTETVRLIAEARLKSPVAEYQRTEFSSSPVYVTVLEGNPLNAEIETRTLSGPAPYRGIFQVGFDTVDELRASGDIEWRVRKKGEAWDIDQRDADVAAVHRDAIAHRDSVDDSGCPQSLSHSLGAGAGIVGSVGQRLQRQRAVAGR